MFIDKVKLPITKKARHDKIVDYIDMKLKTSYISILQNSGFLNFKYRGNWICRYAYYGCARGQWRKDLSNPKLFFFKKALSGEGFSKKGIYNITIFNFNTLH